MLQAAGDFVRNNSIYSGLCVDSRLSCGISHWRLALPSQKIPTLLLERSNFAQDHLDILTLLLEDGTSPFQYFEEALDLDLLVLGGVVQVDQLTDFRQREPEALAAQSKLQANLVSVAVNPVATGAAGREQALVFVEAYRPRSQTEFPGKFGNGVFGVGHARRSLRKRKVESNQVIAARRRADNSQDPTHADTRPRGAT